MWCPYCGAVDTKVIDSRPCTADNSIKRRRECIVCKKRFLWKNRNYTNFSFEKK